MCRRDLNVTTSYARGLNRDLKGVSPLNLSISLSFAERNNVFFGVLGH
jgi:hypothetical protein